MQKPHIRHKIVCPRCKSDTQTTNVDTLELDRCASCAGLWFDVGEIKQLRALADEARLRDEITHVLQNAGATLKPEQAIVAEHPLPCPVCHLRMARRPHPDAPGVVIDRCHQHGTWLDRGEAARLLQLINEHEVQHRQTDAAKKKKSWLSAILDLVD